MKTETGAKKFDCVKWTREVRDRIYEETKDMSAEERQRWREARIRKDPLLSEWFDRINAPEGRRMPAETAGERGAALDP